ncbi:MAG: putative toxin-antitoxin system toxin component, PIN family [Chloroflexi bacterium]|nr:putative toxin-antitoxin system toxin component, PIN family [Chloroflexota bacterium]
MPTDLRFVFDTSAIVSAVLLKHSVVRQAFDKAVAQGKLLVSQATIDEVNEVLRRKGFDKYVLEEERIEFVTALVRDAALVEITEQVRACRDPKDDKFLELAVCGNVACIVSGDDDLISLHPFQGIPIVTPRQFLDDVWKNARQRMSNE